MYVVTLTRVDYDGEDMYVIPTNQGHKNTTYCYVFQTNPYNYDVEYKHGQYLDNFVLYNGDIIEDVYTLGQRIEALQDLNCWEDVEEYFTEL